MPTPLGSFEAVLCESAHALAVAAPLVVQVRRGPMTMDALARIERCARELRARSVKAGGRMGMVAVLEKTASVVGDDVRARQRQVLEGLIEGLDVRIAAMVVGDGLTTMLQRTVARGIMFGNPRVRVVKATDEAAAWIAPHLGAAAAEVASVIERARSLR